MQKAILRFLAPGWQRRFAIWNLGFGISTGKQGFGGRRRWDFATPGFAQLELCNAHREVGFSHNSPRWWRNGVAKLEFAGGGSHEETRGIGARTLAIERHPVLQKWPELCKKATKTGGFVAKSKKGKRGSGYRERGWGFSGGELCKKSPDGFAERRAGQWLLSWKPGGPTPPRANRRRAVLLRPDPPVSLGPAAAVRCRDGRRVAGRR